MSSGQYGNEFPDSGLNLKFPILIQQFPIDADFAVFLDIADEIPVDAGFVGAARLRVARADGHVEGAADLLVE